MFCRRFFESKRCVCTRVLKRHCDGRWRGKSVVVALSGGLDSAVSAYLLQKQGYDVRGVFMKNWNEAEEGHCSIRDDLEQVDKVCNFLNIRYSVIDFQKEYWNRVFQPFLDLYASGKTPNPDIYCNKEIKFNTLVNHIFSRYSDVDYMATGHYVRIAPSNNYPERLGMMCAVDASKDQSYFLIQVNPLNFFKFIFPVGGLKKSQVRKIAIEAGLPNANRKESMGICFIGKRKFDAFIENYLVPQGGDMISIESGEVIGRHRGSCFYTIGQNAAIPGGTAKMFVCEKKDNDIYVCPGSNHPSLFKKKLALSEVNWIECDPPPPLLKTGEFECMARIRHQQPLQECTVRWGADSADHSTLDVEFRTPLRGICVGQFLAMYSDGFCLGGGKITGTGPSCFRPKFRKSN